MASADKIFPLLPAKDLSLILIKIFQNLNQDQDIHNYRLVSKGWKDFIDSHILSSPFYRQKFLQHPLGVPPEKRTPLITAQLDHGFLHEEMMEYNAVLERDQYVLVKRRFDEVHVFTKTNGALMSAGSITLYDTYGLERDQGNTIAMCHDYLFQLYANNVWSHEDIPRASMKVVLFKKQGETWIMCEHRASHLWEQKGRKILGMRQVSKSRILLLVLNKTDDLLQVINLLYGTIELATKNIVTRGQLIRDKEYAVYGDDSTIFDMDAFGLIIYGNYFKTLQHFSFETKEQTWQTVFKKYELTGNIRKAREVTIFNDELGLVIIDNTSGVVKNRVKESDLGGGFRYIPHGFHVIPSDDYLFLGMYKLPGHFALEVFNVSENRMMSFPVTVPEVTLDNHCVMVICMMSKQSKTTVLYTLRIDREATANADSRVLWSGVVWLDARQPGRMIVLSHPTESGQFIGCVSCKHGFFAINCYQCKIHGSCNALESWKY